MKLSLKLLAATAVLLLSACSSPNPGESKFDSLSDLRIALSEADIACTDLTRAPFQSREFEGGTCWSGNYVLGLNTASSDALSDKARNLMSHEMSTGRTIAYGANWFVHTTASNPAPDELMQRIATALNGRID